MGLLLDSFSEEQVERILEEALSILRSEPITLEIDSEELIVVGDIHGDLEALRRILVRVNDFLMGSTKRVAVFLGDLVDRGPNSVEVALNVLLLKLERPEHVFVLRGNHETEDTNRYYGFYDEISIKYTNGEELYEAFNEVFSQLPIAAQADGGKVILLHGGIPKGVKSFEDLKTVKKGLRTSYEDDVFLQVLWNDPDEDVEEFAPSFRGPGIYLYGKKAFERFMSASGAEMLIRAHEYFPEGYRFLFDGKLLSLFSPLDYVGRFVDGKVAIYKRGEVRIVSIR